MMVRGQRSSWFAQSGGGLRVSCAVAGAIALLLLVCNTAAAVEPGWAARGNPSLPNTQYIADGAVGATATECGANAIVLLRVRGSGEDYGTDKLGSWTGALGNALIKRGWRVRDLQARYTAPDVPVAQAVSAALLRNPVGVYTVVKRYRDVASREWPDVHSDLVQVARRCKQRRIAIAAYSQGGIILRYVLPRLPADVRDQIVSVDLVADPTADDKVDGGFRIRPEDSDSRRTSSGIDTFGARRTNPWFKQTAYPAQLAPKTLVYCADTDLVCDARGATVTSIKNWATVKTLHASYAAGVFGLVTAKRIGNAPLPAVTPPAVTPPAEGTPGSGTPQPGSPSDPTQPASAYAGHVVKWSGETPTPVTSWFVTSDLKRLWIPDGGTYNCLIARGAPGPALLAAATLDQLLDQHGKWAPCGDQMGVDRVLRRNMFLASADGRYKLYLQSDGNFVLYGPSGRALWANNRFTTQYIIMQGDGNLVGYTDGGGVTWASNTPGSGASRLVVQNDGNLVMYSSTRAVWSTGTVGRT